MKYSLLRKAFSSLLLSMFLFAALFCGNASEARAAELVTVTGDSSGILQAGGLLEEDSAQEIMPLNLETDYTGASKTLEQAFANFQTTVDLSSYCIKMEDISEFYQNFVNNHPEYFYLNSSYSYNYHSGSDEVYQLIVTYIAGTDELASMVQAYNNKVDEVVASANSSWSDLEKVLYINDYLAVNCEYDTSLNNQNAYNALVEQTAVCQGYALAFQALAGKLGVTTGYVSSNSLNHAWNVAKINGKWYHVDATWDDPTEDRYGRARHAYLLKSTAWFKNPSTQDSAHDAEDYIYYSSSAVSEPNDTGYDAYFWNDVDSPFGYYNGYWYANDAQSIKKYSGSTSGLQERDVVKTLYFKWYEWGSTSSYWPGSYSGCSIFGNKLFYAAPTSIQAIDLTTGQDTDSEVFVLSDQEKREGYIYGFHITSDGVLKYGIAQSPNEAATRKEGVLHIHNYGDWSVTKAPTCTEAGMRNRTCSECGNSIKETIDATGHTPGDAATCTTPQTCTVCNTVIANATGHSYNSGVITTQPTCVKEGIKTFTCTKCKTSYTEAVAKTTAHSFGDWITVTESTCQKEGKQQRTCSVCGSREEKTIPKKAHTPGAAAACTTAQTCTVCNTVIANATGHVHTETKTLKKATFLKTGKASVICKDCKTTLETRTLAKIKCKKGQTYTVGNYKYKIVSAKINGKGTVAFAGLAKNVKTVKIGDTVTILGAKFKITQIANGALKNKTSVTSVTIGKNVQTIGKNAFYGTKKLKTITIKSAKITKVGAKALQNINAKAKIKVPKAKLKKYTSLFKNKGQKKTVKIYRS